MKDLRELLTDGVIVKTRNKGNGLVIAGRLIKKCCRRGGISDKDDYNDKLLEKHCYSDFDIMEIYKIKSAYYPLEKIIEELPINNVELVWKREPEPVSFMEAIKAFEEEKTIKCIKNGIKFIYKNAEISKKLINNNGIAIGFDEILYGEWYIEEE